MEQKPKVTTQLQTFLCNSAGQYDGANLPKAVNTWLSANEGKIKIISANGSFAHDIFNGSSVDIKW